MQFRTPVDQPTQLFVPQEEVSWTWSSSPGCRLQIDLAYKSFQIIRNLCFNAEHPANMKPTFNFAAVVRPFGGAVPESDQTSTGCRYYKLNWFNISFEGTDSKLNTLKFNPPSTPYRRCLFLERSCPWKSSSSTGCRYCKPTTM
jgi:hypothetical protein